MVGPEPLFTTNIPAERAHRVHDTFGGLSALREFSLKGWQKVAVGKSRYCGTPPTVHLIPFDPGRVVQTPHCTPHTECTTHSGSGGLVARYPGAALCLPPATVWQAFSLQSQRQSAIAASACNYSRRLRYGPGRPRTRDDLVTETRSYLRATQKKPDIVRAYFQEAMSITQQSITIHSCPDNRRRSPKGTKSGLLWPRRGAVATQERTRL